ncbi:MAG: aspartate 1-decarboxylase, partial [Armatimonadetes bacterium]|nr:aspartate 1-decarboxylase [Armatimonadota bacterium]NIM22733.1 aspartate 1-decarboxylase [Armatimonadota bacterium]NIM66561.1 aspartate 1-decarboxylase [Armatimonadota bacterium]NIM75098.1 aspartate 1-decarboxylase [Armatimonadota bacterium]NIN04783.1 aspartate 1-decarboxylase [Armatimonadota bacterium]
MLRSICKSKISRAVVTRKELHYDGSITLDRALMEAAKILPYERVQVLNVNNGERFETYALVATEKDAVICLNGPAARLGEIGDIVTIISYALLEEDACQGW